MKRVLILALALCLLAAPLEAVAEFAFVQLGAEMYANAVEADPIATYPAGTWLEIIDEQPEQTLVQVIGSDGRVGYVSLNDVFAESMMNEGDMAVVHNNGKYVNLHTGPSKQDEVLARVNTGTPMTLLSSDGQFDNVMVGRYNGYMLSSMVAKYGQPIFSAYAISANGKSINMRDEPTMNGNILQQLPSGTQIGVYLMGGGWARIGYRNQVGYMMTKFITGGGPGPVPTYVPRPTYGPVPTPEPTYGPVPTLEPDWDFEPVEAFLYVSNGGSTVRYRTGPGTDYSTAGKCYSGDEVYVYSSNGTWSKISIGYGGGQYYMMSQYLVYVDPIDPDPDPYGPIPDPVPEPDPEPDPDPYIPDVPDAVE